MIDILMAAELTSAQAARTADATLADPEKTRVSVGDGMRAAPFAPRARSPRDGNNGRRLSHQA